MRREEWKWWVMSDERWRKDSLGLGNHDFQNHTPAAMQLLFQFTSNSYGSAITLNSQVWSWTTFSTQLRRWHLLANTTPLVLAFSPRSKLSLALESFKDSRRRSSGLRTGLEEEEELELKFEEDFGAGSTLVGEGREVSEWGWILVKRCVNPE